MAADRGSKLSVSSVLMMLGLPLLFLFQNCGGGQMQGSTDTSQQGLVHTLVLQSGNGKLAFVAQLYSGLFGRSATVSEVHNWASQLSSLPNTSCAQIAKAFYGSEEFSKRELDDEDFIASLYQGVLGKSVDEAGLEEWVNLFKSGWSREDVFAAMLSGTRWTSTCLSSGEVPR